MSILSAIFTALAALISLALWFSGILIFAAFLAAEISKDLPSAEEGDD